MRGNHQEQSACVCVFLFFPLCLGAKKKLEAGIPRIPMPILCFICLSLLARDASPSFFRLFFNNSLQGEKWPFFLDQTGGKKGEMYIHCSYYNRRGTRYECVPGIYFFLFSLLQLRPLSDPVKEKKNFALFYKVTKLSSLLF